MALPERWKHDERLRPLWRALALPVGLYFASSYWLPRATSRVTVRGAGAEHRGPAVYVHWHRHLPFLLGHNGKFRRWLIMSPAPYMEPVRRGCVDLARAAGVPVIPMAFTARRGREDARRWDRMLRPGLFDDIVVAYGAPIDASAGSATEMQQRVNQALAALDRS